MQTLKSFFLFCSGADSLLLKRSPSDVNKYVSIGATVFFTGVFAMMAGTYACYTVFNSMIGALIFGALWGVMIFNLDRYLVSSIKKKGVWYSDLTMSIPRIALAVLIAVVIAKPLELKIFDSEIQSELLVMEQEAKLRKESLVDSSHSINLLALESEVARLEEENQAKKQQRDILVNSAIQEADGTGGSMQRNLGPIYRTKKLAADQADEELLASANLLLEKQNQLDELRSEIKTEKQELNSVALTGFAARLEALERVAARSPIIHIASIFIMLLFIAIECAPILVKLMSTRSPYDFVLDKHEHMFVMNHKWQTGSLTADTIAKLRQYEELTKHKRLLMTDLEKRLSKEMAEKEYERLKEELTWDQIFGEKPVFG